MDSTQLATYAGLMYYAVAQCNQILLQVPRVLTTLGTRRPALLPQQNPSARPNGANS